MLNRFWQWTSAPAQGEADSSIPHGPLRFRSWTSADGAQPATIIPHGPLRFRAWTSGAFVPLEPPTEPIGVNIGRRRLSAAARRRRIQDEDEIVIATLTAWLHMKGKQ